MASLRGKLRIFRRSASESYAATSSKLVAISGEVPVALTRFTLSRICLIRRMVRGVGDAFSSCPC